MSCHADPLRRSELTQYDMAPLFDSVNESKLKWASLALKYAFGIRVTCMSFVQEAMSVIWSGVEIFKLVKLERKM